MKIFCQKGSNKLQSEWDKGSLFPFLFIRNHDDRGGIGCPPQGLGLIDRIKPLYFLPICSIFIPPSAISFKVKNRLKALSNQPSLKIKQKEQKVGDIVQIVKRVVNCHQKKLYSLEDWLFSVENLTVNNYFLLNSYN